MNETMGDQINDDPIKTIIELQEENRLLKLQLEDKSGFLNLENYHQLAIEAQKISKIGFWSYSFTENKLFCSDEIYNIFETDLSDDLSDIATLRKYISDHDAERIISQSSISTKSGNTFDIDFHIKVKEGNSKYISIKSKIERDSSGNRTKAIGTVTDITESQYHLDKLKENEQLFRSLFNNLTDIFFIVEVKKDNQGNVIDYIYKDVNPVFEMKFDLNKVNIINKPFSSQVQLFQQFHPFFKIAAVTQTPYQDRVFVQSLDSFLDVLIYSPSKNLIATIWRDVSLMVEASSTLQESEEKYRQIFSIGNDALFLIDFFTGHILDVNPAGCSIFGYAKDELVKMDFKELFLVPSSLEHKIIDKKATHILETNKKSDGTKFPTEASLSYFNWSGRKVVVVSVRDVSERIKAQEDLIQSEKKFKQLFDYSNDAILIIKNYKIIDFNQKTLQIFNLPAELIKNKTLWNLSPSRQVNGEESRMKIVEYIQNALIGNQLQVDWNLQRSDKSVFNADLKISPLTFDTEKVVQVIVRDVSPQKKLELERKTKEDRWKYAFEISGIGVWDWNLLNNEVYFSSDWKKIIGYEKDEIENKFDEFEKRIHPDDITRVYDHIESYFSGKNYGFSVDFRFRCKNGSYKWINSKGKITSYTIDGKPEHFVGIHNDITRQKVIEFEKQELIDEYENACKISQLGYWHLDLRTMILTGSDQTFSILGFSETKQTSLKHIEELIHPEDQKQFISQFISYSHAQNLSYNFRIIINGVTKFILSNSNPVYNGKTLTGFDGIFQDISWLKQNDISIKDEQNLIKSIGERLEQTIVIIQENTILYINDKFPELFGYNTHEINSFDQSIINLFVPEDRINVMNSIESFTKNNRNKERIEARIETKFHKIKWVELIISPFEVKGNNATMLIFNNITKHKHLEIKLTETENTFNTITSLSPLGIAIFEENGTIKFQNTEFKKLTGIDSTDLTKQKIWSIFKETDLTNLLSEINKLSTKEIDLYQDELILNKNIWVTLRIVLPAPINNEKSNYIIYLENIDNIRKQIELLSDENLISKSLFEKSAIGMGIFGNNQELTYFNRSLIDLFHLDESRTTYSYSDFQLISGNQNIKFTHLLQTLEPVHFTYCTKDNHYLKISLYPNELDSIKHISLFASDVTESITTIENLTLKFEKFSTIFELSPVGIALIDKNRNITLSNPKFAQILGQNIHDSEFKKIDQLIPTDYLNETISKLAELFSGVTPNFTQNIQLTTIENEQKWISINTSPFKDRFNDISYGIQVVEDVTLKHLNEEDTINEEKIKTLNHLANSFAHEFNNLLMSIYGNSYLLKSNLVDDSHLSKYANSLFNSLNKASDLTHRLLSFSKTENAIQVVTNIHKLIDEIIDQLSISSTIDVSINFEEKNEIVLGDPSQLQRAIQNIIVNAIEAMPNGGNLTIETKSVYFQETKLLAPELEKGKYLRISIKDTGIGINANELSKIFEPFYSAKKTEMNSGLGLTIALKTIKNHKGTIKVESTLNKGSEFKIFLSQINENLIGNIAQPDEQLLVKGSANILTVDDEDVVRIVTAELLKKLGYNVFSFASPKRAIQFYKENQKNIDLVILDKQMPEMDGIEVYKKMKEINPAIKGILLTGFNLNSEMEKIFLDKENRLIQKPVSIEKLSLAISSLLLGKK